MSCIAAVEEASFNQNPEDCITTSRSRDGLESLTIPSMVC